MNRSDSERVRTVIAGMGYQWTDNENEADLLGVVACSVRQKAIDRVYTRIHRWNTWKQERALVTFVSGCMLPADRDKFLKLFDLVFTMDELPQLPEMLRGYGVVTPYALATAGFADAMTPAGPAGVVAAESRTPRSRRPVMTGLWRVSATPGSSFCAYVPIQNGCDKFCTFCAVPYTRGREVSRPSHDILREVESLVDDGYKSITLLGQNVNSYGRDRGGREPDFAALLRRIGELGIRSGREFWVYFTSPHPRDMGEDVLEMMAAFPCLARQVHLPMQSGDDKVLLRMNRQHSVAEYGRIVEAVRRLMPEATLFTDIIVGFSGEGEEQFENTRRAMDAFRFNMAYIALYSRRPGAASSRWPDDVPLDTKRARLHALNEILLRHAQAWNRRLIGRRTRVLVTARDERHGGLAGLTEGKLHVHLDVEEPTWVGSFVDVEITGAASLSLSARPAGNAHPVRSGRRDPLPPQAGPTLARTPASAKA